MAKTVHVGVLVCALGLSACQASLREAAGPNLARTDQVIAGSQLVERLCVSCHAIGPAGRSPNPSAPPLRTIADRYPPEALEEAFAEGIVVGHPAMPQFQLSAAEIDALVAYLRTLPAS